MAVLAMITGALKHTYFLKTDMEGNKEGRRRARERWDRLRFDGLFWRRLEAFHGTGKNSRSALLYSALYISWPWRADMTVFLDGPISWRGRVDRI